MSQTSIQQSGQEKTLRIALLSRDHPRRLFSDSGSTVQSGSCKCMSLESVIGFILKVRDPSVISFLVATCGTEN